LFVTFEGVGGAGKTTQAQLLHEQLKTKGRRALLTHEPGGTALGETLRDLLLANPDQPVGISPWAEAALFAAARAELVEEHIKPALESGMDVVCDRYIDSSLAYQGIARGLGVEEVLELNLHVTRGLLPDMTFLLLVDLDDALRRRKTVDRIERADAEFRVVLDHAYRELATRFPTRIISIDASGSREEVAEEIRGRIRELS
jgi:dTMP kinase